MSKFYDREGWGAPSPGKALQSLSFPLSIVYLHHTVSPISEDSIADMQRMNASVVPAKFIDTPYNIVVHPNGDIFMGRYKDGVPALGAHTSGKNTISVGLAALGNYVGADPTPEMIDSLAKVLTSWVEQGIITRVFKLIGHQDAPYATSCPGSHLKVQIANILGKALDNIGEVRVPSVPVSIPQTPQTPVSSAPAYPMLLMRGTKGGFVVQIQNKLGIKADGDFGKQTEQAVIAFQKANGLDADGKVGKKTWTALFSTAAPASAPKQVPRFPGLLVRGAKGSNVSLVQQQLKNGGMNISVDGDFGKATEQAIKDFQQFKRIGVDGKIGPVTWAAIFS